MDQNDARKETLGRRQRFGLVFGVGFGGHNRKPVLDDDMARIFSGLAKQPWDFFASFDKTTKSFKWNDICSTKKMQDILQQSFELQDVDFVSESIHRLIDNLPPSNTFLFDVVCICDQIPSKMIPASLYGLLARSCDWHGAKVTFVPLEKPSCDQNAFEDVSAEIIPVEELDEKYSDERLQRNIFWRGDIAFFDDSTKQFYDLSDFELSSYDNYSLTTLEQLMNKNRRLMSSQDRRINKSFISSRLKVISRCHLSTVPPFYLTKARFVLRCLHKNGENIEASGAKSFLELTTSSVGVIVRLDFSISKTTSSFMDSAALKTKSSKLSTENWKKWILNGMIPDEGPAKDEALLNKPVESIFFLIFDSNDVTSNGEKACILLDQNTNGQVRGFEVMNDILSRDRSSVAFDPSLVVFDFSVDIARLKHSIEVVRQTTIEALKKSDLGLKKEDLGKVFCSLMDQCLDTILSKVDVATSLSASNADVISLNDAKHNVEYEDEGLWEEKRFLNLLEHYAQMTLERKQRSSAENGPMKPSGDFVVMEAKELLKLFDADGNAKKGAILQPLPVNTSQIKPVDKQVTQEFLSSSSNWPQLLYTNFHDLYFNKGEKSEQIDRELAKLQQIYVGAKETVSTCSSFNSSREPEVITKSNISQQPPKSSATSPTSSVISKPVRNLQRGHQPRFVASVVRKSPRKMVPQQMAPPSLASAKSQDDLFRQKLRNAVYTSLSGKGINEKSALFRPCFKRLFDICKMYANDMPAKIMNSGGTKRWLYNVAQQHVTTVIELEKSCRL